MVCGRSVWCGVGARGWRKQRCLSKELPQLWALRQALSEGGELQCGGVLTFIGEEVRGCCCSPRRNKLGATAPPPPPGAPIQVLLRRTLIPALGQAGEPVDSPLPAHGAPSHPHRPSFLLPCRQVLCCCQVFLVRSSPPLKHLHPKTNAGRTWRRWWARRRSSAWTAARWWGRARPWRPARARGWATQPT